MPRTFTADKLVSVTARELHANDDIAGTDGSTLHIRNTRTKDGQTIITLWDGRSWSVASERSVSVHAEHGCTCNGRGIFHGRGVVENGVFKGYVGECFGCRGKGFQDRTDVIRNVTYWNKYARIAA